jgi:dihydropteroate synthase
MKRTIHSWKCRGQTLTLGQRTLVMGILNVTPDSFSDGGEYTDPGAAVEHALEMVQQGADIIDIGGESTRPGAEAVAEEEEIRRTIPVIREIRSRSDVPISIDTMKSAVAAEAIAAGADIINDVSAFEADTGLPAVAAESGAGVILMHMRGTPRTMQNDPVYEDVVAEVCEYLEARIGLALEQGISREQIVTDPGIGFGKKLEHNLELLRCLPRLHDSCGPLLVGASRKSFIGQVTGQEEAADRLAGSLGVAAWAAANGAHILRVHDVLDTCDVCRLLDTFTAGDPQCNG